MNNHDFINAYLTCALWSSIDDDGNPLDDTYSLDDIQGDTRESMIADCNHFLTEAQELLELTILTYPDYDLSQAGHDFWLTRNYHGAGFWDRGLNSLGEKLTDIAHKYGEYDLFIDNAAHE